jgi:hypothetical protein
MSGDLPQRIERDIQTWPDFAASSFDLAAGADVLELDALPDDAIDLMQVVREAEGLVS